MGKCKECKAIIRTNYPFGKKSGGRTTGTHTKNCKKGKKIKNEVKE